MLSHFLLIPIFGLARQFFLADPSDKSHTNRFLLNEDGGKLLLETEFPL